MDQLKNGSAKKELTFGEKLGWLLQSQYKFEIY